MARVVARVLEATEAANEVAVLVVASGGSGWRRVASVWVAAVRVAVGGGDCEGSGGRSWDGAGDGAGGVPVAAVAPPFAVVRKGAVRRVRAAVVREVVRKAATDTVMGRGLRRRTRAAESGHEQRAVRSALCHLPRRNAIQVTPGHATPRLDAKPRHATSRTPRHATPRHASSRERSEPRCWWWGPGLGRW